MSSIYASGSGPTPSQTVGPFFSIGLAWLDHLGGDLDPQHTHLHGRVLDGEEVGIPDAMLEFYDGDHLWRVLTDEEGNYQVTICEPSRPNSAQAPHLEVSLFARGLLQRLVTRMYFPDQGTLNDVDPVLLSVDPLRRPTLVASPGPEGLQFDVRLQGPQETVFFVW